MYEVLRSIDSGKEEMAASHVGDTTCIAAAWVVLNAVQFLRIKP